MHQIFEPPPTVTQKPGFSDIQATLRAHNRLRAVHGAPPLEWSEHCADQALIAAKACKAKNTMFHNNCKEHGHGQNIFAYVSGGGERRPDAAAVHSWYAEVVDPGYPFGKVGATCPPGTGHFTQVVWKGTTHVGMACAGDPKTGVFVVANYAPFGNLQNAFLENVSPPVDGDMNEAINKAIEQGKSEENAFAEKQRKERRPKDGPRADGVAVFTGGQGVAEGPELKALLAKIPDFVKSAAPDVVANIVDNVNKEGVCVEVTLTKTGITTVVTEGNNTATSEMSWG